LTIDNSNLPAGRQVSNEPMGNGQMATERSVKRTLKPIGNAINN
jgi:hypothetical protein